MNGTSTDPPFTAPMAPQQHWSRAEWFYMWTKGLDPWRIAVLCRVPYRKVYDHIRGKVTYRPELFGQRLMYHDQPALPPGGLPKPKTMWEERCTELVDFRQLHGRSPHPYIAGESSLYNFLQSQRRRYRAGKLPEARKAYLDASLPGWLTLPKAERERRLWEQRAKELVQFVSDAARYPQHSQTADHRERNLAVWLARQRHAVRTGTLTADRVRQLNEKLSDWQRTVPALPVKGRSLNAFPVNQLRKRSAINGLI